MISDLTDSQQKLAKYMSELSETAFCVGWMTGLEFALWKAVVKGSYKYGMLDISDERITELKELSSLCDGWIIYDDIKEETFVSLGVWVKIYERF